MSKLFAAFVVFAAIAGTLVFAPAASARASCQQICAERTCAMANSKSWCMSQCVPKCEMRRH